MKQGDSEPIRDFKKTGDLHRWTHNINSMNLSVVITYSIVDSIIHEFSLSLKPMIQKGTFQL